MAHAPESASSHVLQDEELQAFIELLRRKASVAEKPDHEARSLAVDIGATWKLAPNGSRASVEVGSGYECVFSSYLGILRLRARVKRAYKDNLASDKPPSTCTNPADALFRSA